MPDFNISEHFINGPGLWVGPDFTSRISVPLGTVPMRSLSDLKDPTILPRNMSDREICRKLLGGKEQATANAVCPSQIWQLIQMQKGGVAGKLLNDGSTNIFYVIGKNGVLFAVGVEWRSSISEWQVFCFRFGRGGVWLQGRQVFSN